MTNSFLKHDCHRMINMMYGKKYYKAYYFLKDYFGYDFHFGDINDRETLVEAHQILYDKLIKKGIDYETGKKIPKLTPSP